MDSGSFGWANRGWNRFLPGSDDELGWWCRAGPTGPRPDPVPGDPQMTTPKPRTAGANALSALTDDELGSAAQRDRRKRIIDATIALASKGGYDAVQMRAVAERADVALGTLYRYFPSKIHLLVGALTEELEQLQDKLFRKPVPGDTATERMMYVLSRVTRTMQRDPMLTEAMTRAFMFADPSAAGEVNAVAN